MQTGVAALAPGTGLEVELAGIDEAGVAFGDDARFAACEVVGVQAAEGQAVAELAVDDVGHPGVGIDGDPQFVGRSGRVAANS